MHFTFIMLYCFWIYSRFNIWKKNRKILLLLLVLFSNILFKFFLSEKLKGNQMNNDYNRFIYDLI